MWYFYVTLSFQTLHDTGGQPFPNFMKISAEKSHDVVGTIIHELGLWFHSMSFPALAKPTRFSLISQNNDSTDIYKDIFSSSTMSTNDSTRAISSRSNETISLVSVVLQST